MERPKTFTILVSKIDSIIVDYNSNDYDPGHVKVLLKQLSGYLWFFVKYLVDSKADHTKKYFIRKIEIQRSKQTIVNKQLAVNSKPNISQAQMDAELSNEENWKSEVDAEALAFECEQLIKQGNEIISVMRTDISLAKKEMENLQ